MNFPEIKASIDATAAAFDAFAAKQDEQVAELRDRLETLESKRGGPGVTTAAGAPLLQFKSASGQTYPLLRSTDRLAGRETKADDFNLAEWVHAQIAGATSTKAVSSGPALVETALSSRIIDAVRDATTIIRAGAQTVMIDQPTAMGRITGDPTVFQHTEGSNDITPSDVSVDAVTLNPKVLAATVPLTGEVLADSPNLGAILETSLTAAFAVKLDALALATILADANVPKSAAGQDTALWAKTLEAVGAAMAAKQPLPTGLICNTADFIARASQLASTAGSWLGKPPALAGMTEYPTTAITAGTALLGGFAESVLIAMRQGLRFEIVRWNDPGRYSHLLIAHMRADGIVFQPKRLFKQLKTVV
ncbi:MAG: phage major capsid protein [Burkholderiaceae bacterium]|nr:phage major capsid protein [Burkholderiaceae bacterium]MDT3680432.1 phage major capsid protein [Burkholderiaceae bacterium]